MNVINIEYDNDPCSLILFRNWTDSLSEEYKHKFGFNDKLYVGIIFPSMSYVISNLGQAGQPA